MNRSSFLENAILEASSTHSKKVKYCSIKNLPHSFFDYSCEKNSENKLPIKNFKISKVWSLLFGITDNEIIVFDLKKITLDFKISKIPVSIFKMNDEKNWLEAKFKKIAIFESDNHTTVLTFDFEIILSINLTKTIKRWYCTDLRHN